MGTTCSPDIVGRETQRTGLCVVWGSWRNDIRGTSDVTRSVRWPLRRAGFRRCTGGMTCCPSWDGRRDTLASVSCRTRSVAVFVGRETRHGRSAGLCVALRGIRCGGRNTLPGLRPASGKASALVARRHNQRQTGAVIANNDDGRLRRLSSLSAHGEDRGAVEGCGAGSAGSLWHASGGHDLGLMGSPHGRRTTW